MWRYPASSAHSTACSVSPPAAICHTPRPSTGILAPPASSRVGWSLGDRMEEVRLLQSKCAPQYRLLLARGSDDPRLDPRATLVQDARAAQPRLREPAFELLVVERPRHEWVAPRPAVRLVPRGGRHVARLDANVLERERDSSALISRPRLWFPACRSITTMPSRVTWRAHVCRNARRCSSSGTFTRLLIRSTQANRRPTSSSSMCARIASAPRTCASISADSSTAVTRCPRRINSCVTRPAPQPSSRIASPGASSWIRSTSPNDGRRR